MLVWKDLYLVNYLTRLLCLLKHDNLSVMNHSYLEVPWVPLWSWSYHGLLHPPREVLCVAVEVSCQLQYSVPCIKYSLAVYLCSLLLTTVPFNTKYTRGIHPLYYLTLFDLLLSLHLAHARQVFHH